MTSSDSTSSTQLSGQHLFTPVAHPELRKLGQKNIHTFLREREQYLLRIKDAQASGSAITPISVKSSVDPDLLLSLVEFGEFEGVDNFEKLTEEALTQWLQDKDTVKFETLTATEIENAIKSSVRMNIREKDPELRIKGLFIDYKTFLRTRKWEGLIESNPKLATGHICSLLKPRVLKEKIINDLTVAKTHLKKQWLQFYRYVVDQAIKCDEFVSITYSDASERADESKDRTYDKRHSDGYRRNGGNNRQHKAGSSGGGDGKTPREYPGRSKVRFDVDKPMDKSGMKNKEGTFRSEKKVDPQELPLCLNVEECSERHLVKDCPKTSKEKAAQLLKAWVAEKSKKGRLNLLSQTPDTVDALQGTGRYFAKLADKVEVIANGYYGADHSVLSEHHLRQCADAHVYVQILPLAHPVSMLLAMADDENTEPKEYLAHRKARISTTLNTAEGPPRLRNVEYLVFKERMSEVLLSRPLLQSLGFNLDEHLSKESYRMLLRPTPNEDPSLPDEDLDRDEKTHCEEDSTELVGDTVQPDSINQEQNDNNRSPWPAFFGDIVEEGSALRKHDIEVGPDNSHKTKQHLNDIISKAIANGLPEDLRQEFSNLIFAHADVFRTKLGADTPAKVEPIRIRLQKDAAAVRVRVHRYSPPQAEFLRNKVDELLQLGLVRRNNSSEWACAPLIVPKEGPEKFRFTVDLRPVNSQTVPHTWPMPDLESVTTQLAGKSQFALIDLCHGYWQMPLHPDSQECQSFITPDGLFTPTRVMHGQTNAATYFQSVVGEAFLSLREVMLQWLDDILLHGRTHRELLDSVKSFLQICRERNIKLHALKVHFFLSEVNWCGRLISGDGARMDPKRLEALLNMKTMGHHLQQFVCAANWMRAGTPEFSRIITPLSQALEKVYEKSGSRKKRAVERVTLEEPFWKAEHIQTFEKIKKALEHSVTLAHPDDSKLLCLFTDASNDNWVGVLTQIPSQDKD